MVFEDCLFNVHDPRLKPRLLHSIIMSHLPDEKQLPRSPVELSLAVASIRRHHLLSETSSGTTMGSGLSKSGGDSKKGPVDAWVDHLLGLLCSTVAENRWAGFCLLGVMCQECSRQRFLESYSSWFQKFILPLKQSTDPVFIRTAACASMTDLLSRLGSLIEYAGVRRDGAALITKLVQPILQILGDKDSSGIWGDAIDLLTSVLRCFPACLRQQSNNVESLLVARLMEADSASLSQKCALCLALLPKAHGDAATWSSMIRRILIAINTELEFAFAGMEDVTNAEDALGALLPMGQDPPRPLGGPTVAANASAQASKRFWQQLVPRVGSLLQCCHYLLTSPYPVPVPVPVGPILALAKRILRVDGSRLAIPSGGAVSSLHQVSLCSEIPALHLSAVDLLMAVLCGVRSQLLPHAGDVVRIVSDYFRRCSIAPVLRVKLYDVARHLFVAMGAGMASALAPAVVGSALSDLKGSNCGTSVFSPRTSRTPRLNLSGWTPGTWSGQTSNIRKRKDPGGLPADHQSNAVAGEDSNIEGSAPVAVQIAALRALEALLTSGGALLPSRWRAEVDAVLACVAMGAATGSTSAGLISDEDTMCLEGSTTTSSAAFQVAAYRALLASLLSPCCHRPTYLSQGLAIFRRGRQEAGTEVADVSAHALLALEALLHPRCLPPAGAISVGVASSRGTQSGVLAPHMQRKTMANSGTISVSTTSANMNVSGTEVPPALKVGQLATDPWAEVDTWLGYGEDFVEEDSLFFEEDNMLVDAFNGGMHGVVDGGVHNSESGYYGSKRQNANGHSNSSPSIGRAGEILPISLEETKLSAFHVDNSCVRNDQCQQGDLVEPASLAQDILLGIPYRDADLSNVLRMSGISQPLAGREDWSASDKSETLLGSRLGNFICPKELSLARKVSSTIVGAVETNLHEGKEGWNHSDSGPSTLTGSFPNASAPKTPSMAPFSFSNPAVEIGSESDSDDELPDIIDGDPDSD